MTEPAYKIVRKEEDLVGCFAKDRVRVALEGRKDVKWMVCLDRKGDRFSFTDITSGQDQGPISVWSSELRYLSFSNAPLALGGEVVYFNHFYREHRTIDPQVVEYDVVESLVGMLQ